MMSSLLTGDDIVLFQTFTLESALALEVKTGMTMGRRSAYSLIKERFDLRGNKRRVLEQFHNFCNQLRLERGLPERELLL